MGAVFQKLTSSLYSKQTKSEKPHTPIILITVPMLQLVLVNLLFFFSISLMLETIWICLYINQNKGNNNNKCQRLNLWISIFNKTNKGHNPQNPYNSFYIKKKIVGLPNQALSNRLNQYP